MSNEAVIIDKKLLDDAVAVVCRNSSGNLSEGVIKGRCRDW